MLLSYITCRLHTYNAHIHIIPMDNAENGRNETSKQGQIAGGCVTLQLVGEK